VTVYTLFGQAGGTDADAGDTNPYTLGIQFSVSQAATLTGIWFYSHGAGATVLPQVIALFAVSGGALIHSETASWSGAAGAGWVRAAFSSPPALSASTNYVGAVLQSTFAGWHPGVGAYWSTGAGSAGITNGPLSAPNNASSANGQDTYNGSGTLTFPAGTFNATNYWIDVEVTVPGPVVVSPAAVAFMASMLRRDMAIYSAGINQAYVNNNVQNKLLALRSALNGVNDLYLWLSAYAQSDLVALGFSAADAADIFNAVTDAHELYVLFTGGGLGTYTLPYNFSASQRIVTGPLT
jgi:uncharacterized protein DUF4082